MDHPAHKALTASVESSLLRDKITKHIDAWQGCTNCSLHTTASWHVVGSGTLPCDVLFISEAPGNDENDAGKPFAGKAGDMLNKLLAHVNHRLWRSHKIRWEYRYTLTNLVACLPRADKYREPSIEEVEACSPRLSQLLQLANPKGIVFLGAIATKYGKRHVKHFYASSKERPEVIELYHPAYFVRAKKYDSPEYNRWVKSFNTWLANLYRKTHSG